MFWKLALAGAMLVALASAAHAACPATAAGTISGSNAVALQAVQEAACADLDALAGTSGGVTTSTYSANVTTAGAGAGTGGVAIGSNGVRHLFGYQIYNGNASVCYIQFLDQTQALANLGTTVPVKSVGIPANGGANLAARIPIITTATALTIGVTTTRAGSTACATGLDINLDYN